MNELSKRPHDGGQTTGQTDHPDSATAQKASSNDSAHENTAAPAPVSDRRQSPQEHAPQGGYRQDSGMNSRERPVFETRTRQEAAAAARGNSRNAGDDPLNHQNGESSGGPKVTDAREEDHADLPLRQEEGTADHRADTTGRRTGDQVRDTVPAGHTISSAYLTADEHLPEPRTRQEAAAAARGETITDQHPDGSTTGGGNPPGSQAAKIGSTPDSQDPLPAGHPPGDNPEATQPGSSGQAAGESDNQPTALALGPQTAQAERTAPGTDTETSPEDDPGSTTMGSWPDTADTQASSQDHSPSPGDGRNQHEAARAGQQDDAHGSGIPPEAGGEHTAIAEDSASTLRRNDGDRPEADAEATSSEHDPAGQREDPGMPGQTKAGQRHVPESPQERIPDSQNNGEETAEGEPALDAASKILGSEGSTDTRISEGDPVDVATGDVILAETDATLPGVLPLVLQRTHRSSMRTGRWFGRSWISSFDQRLLVTADRVIGAFADGRVLAWTYPNGAGDSPMLPLTGPMWPLRRNPDGSYTVTDPQRGLTWRFEHRTGYEATTGDQGELPLVSLTDRAGHEIAFSYDGAGRPVSVSHSGGYRVQVTVTDGHVTGLALAGRDNTEDVPLRSFDYDADGNLAGIVNSSGLPLRFTYDNAGRLTNWADRNGHYYRYTYDPQGRCIRGEGSGRALSGTFSYEPGITRWTDGAGAVTTYEITDSAHVATITDPLGNVTRWEHDARGRVTTRVDPLGRVTRYAYDHRGNLIAITRPDGSQMTAMYDEQCQPVLLTGPDGAIWRQEYDVCGNRTALIAPDAGISRYGRDENGRLTSITDAAGAVTRVTSNTAGLPVEVISPEGGRTRYERDPLGRVTEVTGPDGAVTGLSWTVEGRLAARSFPDGTAESWTYDGEGNLASHLNAAGAVTAYEYGPFDRLAALTGPDGTRTEFGYDHGLRLTSVAHGGLTWRYGYDTAGRLAAETDYNDATTSYAYDLAGQLTTRVNAVGQRVTFRHDQLGNLTERATGGVVTTFGYDPADRLVSARNPDADLQFDRDELGRVTAETCNGRTVTSEYDTAGRLTRRVTPSGTATDWGYNLAGQPIVMTAGGHEILFGYDPVGREIRRDLPGGLTLTQGWDQRGQLTLQALTSADSPLPEGPVATGQMLQRRVYTYHPDGLVADIGDLLAGDRRIGLDRAGRVTTVTGQDWAEQYAYDQTGNITAASWPALPSAAAATWLGAEARGQRQVTGTLISRAGNIRYRHDRQGRVIQRQRTRISRKPETWHYKWDADNRMTAVTTPDGTTWRYLYDPLGRRIAKQHLSPDGNIVEQTEFTWSGVVLVEQAAMAAGADRQEVVSWNYQPGTFTPLTQAEYTSLHDVPQDQTDQRFYAIITDLVGTPTELTSPNGTLVGHQRQTLWGRTAWSPGGAQTPLRFPGQYEDPETGLHYNNQRYYDPVNGSYLTSDPLGLAPAPNPHTYVSNPYALTDPLGLESPCDEDGSGTDPDWLVGRHRDMPSPRPKGYQSHHGVNTVWAEVNIPGYNPDDAPAILMKNNPYHNATRGVFNRWRAEIAARHGTSIAGIDWSVVSSGEIWRLAENQFSAAHAPQSAVEEYYRQWNDYLTKLGWWDQ